MPSSSPTLSLNDSNGIKKWAVSTRPTSSSPQHYISPYNTRLLKDGTNNNYNYILDNLINGLAKESNNKDGENVIDEGKAENYSDGSNNSNDIDNDDSGDGNSSNSNKGSEARGCIGRRGLLTPIIS